MKSFFKKFWIPFCIFITLEFIFLTDFWDEIEWNSYNSFMQFRGQKEIQNDVVIVAIDDETFATLNDSENPENSYNWPFPREIYAHLIENLNKAGAKLIVFDIEFTETTNTYSDSILASTAEKYGNVVFAGKVSKESNSIFSRSQIVPPIQEITKRNLPWGVVNINMDSDNFVRRYSLYQLHNKEKIYSIGLAALGYLKYKNKWKDNILEYHNFLKINDLTIMKNGRRTALINFYGGVKTFPTYSLGTVLDDETFDVPGFDIDAFEEYLNNNTFKDKIVLIGASADELHDNFATPFFSDMKLTPGVEIHANFLEMVLNNDFIKVFSFLYLVFLHFFLIVIIFYLNIFFKPVVSIFLNLILIGTSIGLSYWFFVERNTLLPILQLPLIFIITYFVSLIVHYIKTAKERKQIRNTFGRYMSPELVKELLKDPNKVQYGGSQQEVSVLFSDIRSFTTYTESHTAEQTVSLLREYLTAMVDIIIKHGGTLDKFVGDEIMALFGTPVYYEDHAIVACRVALEMRKVLTELQKKWVEKGFQPFEIGIGVNSGMATVGNLGSEQIFDYTAIGDTINLGARLEAINKEYDTEKKIIISEFTLAKAPEKFEVRYLDEVKVKGKNIPVKIYELISIRE